MNTYLSLAQPSWLRLVQIMLVVTSCALPVHARRPAPEQGGTSRITVQVSNGATRTLLEGAIVEVPALGRRALTDNLGRFTFDHLPAGQHAVAVTYIGLNREERLVAVAPGAQVNVTFDLGSDVYWLEKFSVVGEREGNAAALTAQRNADSVKSVVALDAYGAFVNFGISGRF